MTKISLEKLIDIDPEEQDFIDLVEIYSLKREKNKI